MRRINDARLATTTTGTNVRRRLHPTLVIRRTRRQHRAEFDTWIGREMSTELTRFALVVSCIIPIEV